MKVLGINGSPHKNGNTALMIRTVFAEIEKAGIETELYQIADHPVKPCTACRACFKNKNGFCALEGDALNDLLSRMYAADGIIMGSPVYSSDVTAQIKAVLDRCSMVLAANRGRLKHKAGAAVVAARRGGATHTLDTLTHFLHSKEMFLVGSTYWNMAYGNAAGEAEADTEGMENMRNLGENMAWLIKRIG
jgi:multimeric flavodoxin WrbA